MHSIHGFEPHDQDTQDRDQIAKEERDLEQAAAAASGETLSEFVRRAARHEAERTLAERTRYILDDEAAQRFLTAHSSVFYAPPTSSPYAQSPPMRSMTARDRSTATLGSSPHLWNHTHRWSPSMSYDARSDLEDEATRSWALPETLP